MRTIRFVRYSVAAITTLLASRVLGVTSVSDDEMDSLLSNNNGVDLALQAAPMWFFGQALNRPPCYPTSATTGDSNDQQTASVEPCGWPDAGCKCRTPDLGTGNEGPDFPVYFTYSKCNDEEVRVAYNLFYEKDGFSPDEVLGHPYDWERVVVVWKKSDSDWAPSQLFLSQHSGYDKISWGDIQNTLSTADAGEKLGGENGRRNLDHAKVYVAWAKHDVHQDRNTGWNDALSQLTNNAFRSQDWWYFPKSSDYIRADNTTDVGKLLHGWDWASATSDPVSVHSGLCSA